MVMIVRTSDLDGYDDGELYGWANSQYGEPVKPKRNRTIVVKAKAVVPPPPKPKKFSGGLSVTKSRNVSGS